jgi:TRAP-type C4-dicarboxylate transport system substrate-binding protein
MRALVAAVVATLTTMSASAEPTQLKFAFMPPPQSPYISQAIQPWIDAVQKDAPGAVEVKIFHGPQLATYNNVLDRITNGVVEIAYGIFGNLGSQFPKPQVSVLPFEADDTETPSVAIWRLYEQGLINDGLEGVKPLAIFVFPYSSLHSAKPIKTLDDMKGTKIAVFSRQGGEMIELLGGTPITMQPTDIYASMQRGVITASVMGWAGVPTFKLQEVAPQHLEAPLGNSPAFIIMNKDAYAKLPEHARRAIDRHSGEALSRAMGKSGDRQAQFARNTVKAMADQAVYALDKAEEARWRDKLKPVTEDWVRTTPNGAKILEAFRAELGRLRAK